jgi:hypothetical protein
MGAQMLQVLSAGVSHEPGFGNLHFRITNNPHVRMNVHAIASCLLWLSTMLRQQEVDVLNPQDVVTR